MVTRPFPFPVRSPRLTIRPAQREDMPGWEALHSSAEERTHLNGPLVRSAADWWAGNEMVTPEIEKILTVTMTSTGEFVGICGYLICPWGELEPYLMLKKEFSGKGLGSEVVSALVSVALDSLGVPSLRAVIAPMNIASLKLVKKLGFTFSEEHSAPDKWQDKHHVYVVNKSTYIAP